jgi:hypothetical protein
MLGKMKEGGSYLKSEVVKLEIKIEFFFIFVPVGRGKE